MLSQLTSLLGLAPAKSVPEARKDAQPDTDFAKVFAEAEDDAQTFQPDPAPLTDADEVDSADTLQDPDDIDPKTGEPEAGVEWVDDLDLAPRGPEDSRDVALVDVWLDPEPDGEADAKDVATLVDFLPADPTKPKGGSLQPAEDSQPKRGLLDDQPDLDRDAEKLPDLGSVVAGGLRKVDSQINTSGRARPEAEIAGTLDRSADVDTMRGPQMAAVHRSGQTPAFQAIETEIKPADSAARAIDPSVPVPPIMSQSDARFDMTDRLPPNRGSASPLTGNVATKPAAALDSGLPDIPVFRFGLSQPAREPVWPRIFESPVSQPEPVSVSPEHALRTGTAFGLAAVSPEDGIAGTFQARAEPASPLPVDWSEGAAQDRPHRLVSEPVPAGLRGSVPGDDAVNVQPKSTTGMVDPRGAVARLNTDLSLAIKPATGTSGKGAQADPVAIFLGSDAPQVTREVAPRIRAGTSALTPDVSRPAVTPEGATGPAADAPAAADRRGPKKAIRHAGLGLNGEVFPLPKGPGAEPAARREPIVTTREMAPPATRTEPVAQALASNSPADSNRYHLRRDPDSAPRPDRVFTDRVTQLRPELQGAATGKADALAAAPGGATPALAGLPVPGTSARVTSPFLDDLAEDLLPLDSQPVGAAPGTHSSPAQVVAMPQAMQRTDAAAILRQVSDGMARLGEGSVEIRLSPEELGQVRMQMVPSDGGMTVHITADRPETLDLMRRHIDQLARDLADAGYESASFSFGEGGEGGEDPAPRQDRAKPMPQDDTPATVARTTEAYSDGLDLRF